MPDWVLWAYYLTGGPLLCLLALLGLWQLNLAKRNLDLSRQAIEVAQADLERRSESERTRLAVDMCLRFTDNVLPLIDVAYGSLKGKPLPLARPECDPWDLHSYDETKVRGLGASTQLRKAVYALNAMESVAIPLASNAADGNLARDSIGVTFVEAAVNLAFVVAFVRETRSAAFPALRSLADQWGSALTFSEDPNTRLRVFSDAEA